MPKNHNHELFNKLGGEPGIESIITELHLLIKQDSLLPPFFKTWQHHLYQKQYICHLLTGQVYNRKPLKKVHQNLKIDARHFDRFLQVFDKAMESKRVSPQHRKAMLEILKETKSQIIPFDYTISVTFGILALSIGLIILRKTRLWES